MLFFHIVHIIAILCSAVINSLLSYSYKVCQ